MVNRRTGTIVAFLMLLSPITALQVARGVGLNSTQVTSNETTSTYTSTNLQTYFGSSRGMITTEGAVSFPPRIIGFMAPKGKCSVYSLPVFVTSGTSLSLRISSDQPVNLYLFSGFPAGGWSSKCNLVGSIILSVNNFTKYILHWTARENGTLYFVFTGSTAVILLTNVGSMRPVEQIATITYTSSVETELALYSSTTIATSTIMLTDPLYAQATFLNWMILVGVIVTMLIVMLVHRRNSSSNSCRHSLNEHSDGKVESESTRKVGDRRL